MARKVILGASILSVVVAFILPHIQQEEGTKYKPYYDVNGIPTVCSGHTDTDVIMNKTYSVAECKRLTQEDISKAELGILNVSPQLRTRPMQLAAAISFSYNVGVGAYEKSSVARDFNLGNYKAGCADMLKYVYAGGKYYQGLYNRRKQEYTICMSDLTTGGKPNVGTIK